MRPFRISTYDGEHGAWVQAEAAPDPRLGGLVSRYQGYRELASTFPARRELPSTKVTLILSFGGRERVRDPRRPDEPETWGSMVTGIWDTYALSSLEPGWHGMQIDLSPMGAYSFFGQPVHVFSNRVIGLEDVMGREGAEVVERLESAPGWGRRFELLDEIFLSRLARHRLPSTAVVGAWSRISNARGRRRVNEIAEELGCSRNHLWNRFREEVGASPKLVSRILRFRHALELIDHGRETILARIAVRSGYYDQSHLVRDCRRFTGWSPSELVARRLPDGFGTRE